MDTTSGVTAWHIVKDSPAAKAGIKQGDIVDTVRGFTIHRATDVTRVLYRVAPWMEIRYQLRRDGRAFETPLVTAPQDNSSSIENYLRFTALLYLFIGLFIFARRWNAPRAIHFYIFCLVSFILYSFHYSGKLNSFDATIYWAHAVSAPVSTRYWRDKVEQANLGIYFLVAAVIFLMSYRRAPTAILRQQLKWVTGGTFAGTIPFLLLYIVPYVFGIVPASWMKASACSLALIPLCFGYAIIRYR